MPSRRASRPSPSCGSSGPPSSCIGPSARSRSPRRPAPRTISRAKTLAVSSLAQALSLHFRRIQFTPDLLPADLTGTLIYNPKDGTFTAKRGPLFSHILQVVAYCVLLEEEYGHAPPYGIIRYGDTAFEIEYNEDQKSLLLQKLGEMRAAIARGGAHRNHNRPGKCIHCSRRAACPERLA